MKRTLSLLLVSALSLFGLGCSAVTPGPKYAIVPKTYPFRLHLDPAAEKTTEEITLYFINGGDIPYVALHEYMPFVGRIYKEDGIGPAAEYVITHPVKNHTMAQRVDNGAMMDISADIDTIEFVDYNRFVSEPESTIILNTINLSDDGRGGVSNLLKDSGSSYDRGGKVLLTFDMKEYGIDLIEQDGVCYVPLQTINDLLVSQNYKFVVFNGEKVIGCTFSSDLIEEMYEAPNGVMSEAFAKFNYNELRFMLDTFYGLKEEHDIDNFGDFFSETNLIGDLAGTDPVAFDLALRRLVMKYLDDGHSGLKNNSYMTGKTFPNMTPEEEAMGKFDDFGASQNARVWESVRIKSSRQQYYPDDPKMDSFDETGGPYHYEEVGDTAIITFDTFTAKKNDYYTEADLENPDDTIELIAYAHSQITRENSPIKNVVVDLSNNLGGAADAAVFLMSWLSNDGTAKLALRDTLTGAQSFASYWADVNFDGEFYVFEDALPSKIARYILTTSISFSCANLVPASLKGTPNVILLGLTSGGGTCVVRPCTTASGAVFLVSSNRQISYVRNGSMYNVDQGAEPDFTISKFETMYDRQKLVQFIHELP